MNKRLIETAYHEASHGVMAIAKNILFKHISIEPKGDFSGHMLGKHTLEQISNLSLQNQQNHLLVMYAGLFATKKYKGRFDNRGARGDYSNISEIIFRNQPNSNVANAYLNYIKCLTEAFFNNEHNWKQVVSLADALLERKTIAAADVKSFLFK